MSGPSPREIHDVDQALAWFRNVGVGFGTMYAELLAKGVPPDHARDITVEYVRGFLRQFQASPPKPPEEKT